MKRKCVFTFFFLSTFNDDDDDDDEVEIIEIRWKKRKIEKPGSTFSTFLEHENEENSSSMQK